MHTNRQAAREAGEKKYMAARPCKNGHDPIRYVCNNECVGCVAKQGLAFYSKNRSSELKKRQALREKNRSTENLKKRERAKVRRSNDPLFRLADSLRARISAALRAAGSSKRTRTTEIIGCSIEELCAHIERQFLPGMGWANRGMWHIDHIVPLASAGTTDDLLALCHVSNLRPVWARENMKKSSKITHLI